MASSANVMYILEHREIVQAHIQNHKLTWPPSRPDDSGNVAGDAPVKVCIRVRPLLPRDEDAQSFSLVEVQDSQMIHVTHPTIRWAGGRIATKTYDADIVFSEIASSKDVYDGMRLTQEIAQLMHQDGSELSILAYGQTGTGKTFTTTSLEEQIASEIFDLTSPDCQLSIRLSILEIRGSASYDLLSEPALQPITIFAGSGSAQFQGLSVHEVSDKEALLRLIKMGRELRLTRSTSKNDTSSRSHSIVSIKISQTKEGASEAVSYLNVVDLAGSERSSIVASHDAERVKESIDTNKSLAALKDCIRARLSDKPAFVPWRGNKLTMALKGAFENRTKQTREGHTSPSSKLFIIACVSPSVIDIEDTLNTLKYVTPFQLSAASAVDATVRQSDLQTSDDPRSWSHARSKTYITRNMPKLAALADRLLPHPSSTIASLFPLNAQALELLTNTPAPSETVPPDPRVLGAARPWISSYHKKLQDLAGKCAALDAAAAGGGKRAFGVVATASAGVRAGSMAGANSKGGLLAVLNGTDPSAHETGRVQRIFEDGTPWKAIERLESANR
ncbi:P-loop containing nucleoside triphosphate hydrolase protein [Auriscalpium vulgare]|uniref:P-loop containing nucleoside triphosphate hydrolase protein n=1 Tax=Auriscalpium vulgare TaxID=40419 RepID=A0ACB8RNS0_9AGAM|nr:P-loop containing nucleoside triphosphate hydrolase protein [Auriscalpium vulgare]